MPVGFKDALTGDQTMEVDATWASSRAANGYSGETVSIAGYNRSFDTYTGPGTLTATAGNDALLQSTLGSAKVDSNGTPVADAAHFAGIGTFVMGLGNDVLDLTSAGGGAGSYGTGATVYGDRSGTLASGAVGGNDVLWGGGGVDAIHGDGGAVGFGGTGGSDDLHGGAGNDTIYGDANGLVSNPTLGPAVAGGDLIDGGAGDDLLFGDGRILSEATRGQNTFAFDGPGSGDDTIGQNADNGFQHGLDHIRLDADYGYADAAAALAHTSDVGGRAVVDLGSGDRITLAGVTTSQLDASDFVIA